MSVKEGYIANWKNYPKNEIKIRVARPSVLSPSKELLREAKEGKISWGEYLVRFLCELGENDKAIRELLRIRELVKQGKTVRLICYEKNYPCHRFILKDLLDDAEKT